MSDNAPDRDLFGEPIEVQQSENNSAVPTPKSKNARLEKRARKSAANKHAGPVSGDVSGNGLPNLPLADDDLVNSIFESFAAHDCYPHSVMIMSNIAANGRSIGAVHLPPKPKSSGAKRNKAFSEKLRAAGLRKFGEWVFPDQKDLLIALTHLVNALDNPCYIRLRGVKVSDLEDQFNRFVGMVSEANLLRHDNSANDHSIDES